MRITLQPGSTTCTPNTYSLNQEVGPEAHP